MPKLRLHLWVQAVLLLRELTQPGGRVRPGGSPVHRRHRDPLGALQKTGFARSRTENAQPMQRPTARRVAVAMLGQANWRGMNGRRERAR